ncbi:MAG TPA: site-specific integrase [Terriglobales bacterium]|nr:site-specific integrase [Terriglobales bacterium]
MRAAEGMRLRINKPEASPTFTVEQVAQRYILERMPRRHSTSRGYKRTLGIIQRSWGTKTLPLKAYEVEVWLKTLASAVTGKPFAPKTKAHIKNMLHMLHDCAMVWEYIPVERNPMNLVRIEGAGKRMKDPLILTMEEFRKLLSEITEEPYRTMILLAGCLGLRISEVLGLRWQDFDWLQCEVSIQRGVVEGITDDVKTQSSRKKLPLDIAVVTALKDWKLQTQFPADNDYVFASPVKLGKKPLHGYTAQRDVLKPAAIRAGFGPVGWHSLRHSYRTWLDETGASVSVQRELMRHSTIAMTMDGYGRGVAAANRDANSRLVGRLLGTTGGQGSDHSVQ